MKKILMIVIVLVGVFGLSGCNKKGKGLFTENLHDTDYQVQTYVYKESYGENIELDIVYPHESSYEDLPVVVYIHGGGYIGGSKEKGYENGYFWYVNKQFLEAGYALVSIDYTLAKEKNGTTMEDCFTDSKDAIRWLNQNEEMLGIDTSNIGVFGTSAGGGIATMLGYTDNDDFVGDSELAQYSSEISFVVNFYGGDTRLPLYNYEEGSPDELSEELIEYINYDGYRVGITVENTIEEIISRLELLSSLTYVDSMDTPTITFHGTSDTTVDYLSSTLLHHHLSSLNVEEELYLIENMGHGFSTNSLSDNQRLEFAELAFEFAHSQYK